MPTNNFVPTLQFFQDYISSNPKTLQCHKKDDTGQVDTSLCATTALMCAAMNNCSGNGVCDETTGGKCVCNDGWKFADCSLQTQKLTDGFIVSLPKLGPVWYSFTYEGSPYNTILGLAANNIGVDVYVAKGKDSNPHSFSYDMSFRNITSINLSSYDIVLGDEEGFSLAMYVPAINELTNQLLDSQVVVKFEEKNGALGSVMALWFGLTFIAALF